MCSISYGAMEMDVDEYAPGPSHATNPEKELWEDSSEDSEFDESDEELKNQLFGKKYYELNLYSHFLPI